eukprot:8904229-Pyramimonas_sp.AAC.1
MQSHEQSVSSIVGLVADKGMVGPEENEADVLVEEPATATEERSINAYQLGGGPISSVRCDSSPDQSRCCLVVLFQLRIVELAWVFAQ